MNIQSKRRSTTTNRYSGHSRSMAWIIYCAVKAELSLKSQVIYLGPTHLTVVSICRSMCCILVSLHYFTLIYISLILFTLSVIKYYIYIYLKSKPFILEFFQIIIGFSFSYIKFICKKFWHFSILFLFHILV